MRALVAILSLFPLGCLSYIVFSYAVVLARRPRAPLGGHRALGARSSSSSR